MIYLDNNATTQPTPGVIAATVAYLGECYANASASTAAFTGADKPRREAASAMMQVLHAEEPECIVFTSGATESNNWVFASAAEMHNGCRIIFSAIEHSSVSESATALMRKGFDVVELPVDKQGVVQLDALTASISANTVLVSIMAANNETGVLQPIHEIGKILRQHNPAVLFHSDATQLIGKLPVDLHDSFQDVDLLSFSAHKFHGPKGVGGLYIRPGTELLPLLRGGGQENGLRAGTTNTPGLAGMATAAAEIDLAGMRTFQLLRDDFESKLLATVPDVVVHSQGAPRLPNTSCFSIPGATGEDIAYRLAALGIIVGTGSACSSGAGHPPKTVLAMGVDYTLASGTIRISADHRTSEEDYATVIDALAKLLQ
ncbi:MAG: cysteine desulfurase family protein [bacterium]